MDLGLTCRCGGKSVVEEWSDPAQTERYWRCDKCRAVLARQASVRTWLEESKSGPIDPDFNVVTTHPQPSGVQ